MSKVKSRRPLLSQLPIIAVAVGLVFLIVRYSLLAYLASADPELALRIDPNHPVALMHVAEGKVARAEEALKASAKVVGAERRDDTGLGRLARFAGPPDLLLGSAESPRSPQAPQINGDAPPTVVEDELTSARDMVTKALLADPLNYRALTLRGRIEDLSAANSEAGSDAALRYYELAARLSPRASQAIYRLMLRDLDAKDYVKTAERADTLLRTVSRAPQFVVPVLARLAEIPEASPLVLDLLKDMPPWRGQFFATLNRSISDARTPLLLLLALKKTDNPPTDVELKSYVNFLFSKKLHELAYYTWLQFLTAEQLATTGLVYNSGFSTKPSGFPFDWTIAAGTGVTAEVAAVPDETGQQALRIEFLDGRANFGGVSQLLLLPPGRYKLSGRHRGELTGKRGLRWLVTCSGSTAQRLAETGMHLGPISTWRPFEFGFTVPSSDCPGQFLRLVHDARSASERLIQGVIWYDDIVVVRTEANSVVR